METIKKTNVKDLSLEFSLQLIEFIQKKGIAGLIQKKLAQLLQNGIICITFTNDYLDES